MTAKHEHSVGTERNKGVILKLLNITYYKDEVYLVIEIKNRSGIDFEIDYLNVSRVNGNNKRKAPYQNLQLKVLYKHKLPDVIMNKHMKRFVYVLPKFVLGKNEKLEIEIQELKGSRNLILKIKL